MGVSNSLFSIREVQGQTDFTSHLEQLNSYQTPNVNYVEINARNPTLNEIYEALRKAGIQTISERKVKDEIQVKEGKAITIHIFEIMDKESESCEDLTIRYEAASNSTEPVQSISGIKTHHRILVKIAAELTAFCGSLFIMNAYESYFIQKGKTYDEIWNDLKKSS